MDDYGPDLFKSAEDEAWLLSLKELERESVLYERKKKLQARQEKHAAAVRAREALEKSQGKQKEESKRKKGSKRKTEEDALQDFRERRRKDRKKQLELMDLSEDEEEDEEVFDEDVYEDEDEDEEREEDKGKKGKENEKGKVKEEKDIPLFTTKTELSLEDVKKMQIRRAALEQIQDEGYLEGYISRMFVRVLVRVSRQTKQPVYNMAQIVGIVEHPRKYQFGKSATNKALNLRIGKSDRNFKMSDISNSSITEDEFRRWKDMMQQAGCEILSKEDSIKLVMEADKYKRNFRYSAEDVERIVKQQRRAFEENPVNITRDQLELERLKEAELAKSESERNTDYITQLDSKIFKLQELEMKNFQKATRLNLSKPVATGLRLAQNAPNAQKQSARSPIRSRIPQDSSRPIVSIPRSASLQASQKAIAEIFNKASEMEHTSLAEREIPADRTKLFRGASDSGKELKTMLKLHATDLDIDPSLMEPVIHSDLNIDILNIRPYPRIVLPEFLSRDPPAKSLTIEAYINQLQEQK